MTELYTREWSAFGVWVSTDGRLLARASDASSAKKIAGEHNALVSRLRDTLAENGRTRALCDKYGIVSLNEALADWDALAARLAEVEQKRDRAEAKLVETELELKRSNSVLAAVREHSRPVRMVVELAEAEVPGKLDSALHGWFVQQETRQLLYASAIDLADEPVMPLAEWIEAQR